MKLGELLRPELIKANLEAEKKRLAISELVDQLVQYHELPLKQRDGVLEELYANEEMIGSGMEMGIAVPHLSTDRVDDILCALGISKKGVPFRTLDGKAARVVVLLLFPKRNFAGEVQAIRSIERLLDDEDFLTRLTACKTGEQAYELIAAQETAAK